MGLLNGYLNEQIEAKKAQGLYAIARAIDNLAESIDRAAKTIFEQQKKSEVEK